MAAGRLGSCLRISKFAYQDRPGEDEGLLGFGRAVIY